MGEILGTPSGACGARQSVQATLAVSCPKCQHEAFIKVAQWPHGMPVALLGSIMECSKCGSMGADVRLVRKERRG